nr:uncharacterized protein LOC112276825 isoform X3 [Physcomitrium patens]|eukprot:XP_024364325.1 uncharacterized protein LOC112276825 isoform X3 [Physcomitrella patens]
MRRASRVVSSIMAATRRYGVPGAIWELCAPNRRIARAGNHYFISLERRVLWNIDLQGLSSSRQFGGVSTPVDRNPGWGIGSGELKEKRARGVVAAAREDVKKSVVVVESPSKAKTITKYLGPRAQVLVLASDPDREGEAIAWHVLEMLKMEGALKRGIEVKRVVFHEITKSAVTRAMESPRDVSETLVNAYLARRALDYLIGFNLSPVLWRKLPGSKSAGRVQSAALRIICDREQEIDAFQSREYWTVEAQLSKDGARSTMSARLTHLNGEKLDQFSLNNELDASSAYKKVSETKLRVGSVKKRLVRRNPVAPYITSTLQQDASAKLGFGPTRTMSIAQQLYEGVKLNNDEQTGLITYMRTDGVQISPDALESIRSLIGTRYGEDYVPAEKRVFVSKVKNAQEAHEAIRPTDIFRLPSSVANVLEEDALQLYSLIWARTVACQLEPSVSRQVSVDVVDDHQNMQLRASSSSISFPGFLVVYKDVEALGKFTEKFQDDDTSGPISDLDQLEAGNSLMLSEVRPTQHFTEPPPRFSEGTLVKRLEELGIGRPSTYAPTLRTLQLRNYVGIDKRRMFPETRGRMVSAFLMHYFPEFSDLAFTANMESQLDDVSAGNALWKDLLREFWPGFHGNVLDAMKVPVEKVVEMLEEVLAKQFFPSTGPGAGDRICPSCKEGKVSVKLSRFGAGYFFGCSRYPDCLFKASMISGEEEESSNDEDSDAPVAQWSNIARPAKVLGVDPATQLQVLMRVGPYGAYVQLGEASKKQKPRRTTLPKGVKSEEVTLQKALELLSYPRELGKHPAEGTPIIVSIGKFGFFLRHRAIIASVPLGVSMEDLSIDKAVEILKGKHVSRRGRRPRKVVAKETDSESTNSSESSPHDGDLSPQHNGLVYQEEQNTQVSQEKQKRKYVRKSSQDSSRERLSQNGVLSNGSDPVVKKRGKGRPRKNVAASELILAQGE